MTATYSPRSIRSDTPRSACTTMSSVTAVLARTSRSSMTARRRGATAVMDRPAGRRRSRRAAAEPPGRARAAEAARAVRPVRSARAGARRLARWSR